MTSRRLDVIAEINVGDLINRTVTHGLYATADAENLFVYDADLNAGFYVDYVPMLSLRKTHFIGDRAVRVWSRSINDVTEFRVVLGVEVSRERSWAYVQVLSVLSVDHVHYIDVVCGEYVVRMMLTLPLMAEDTRL